jgi:hypothetical protein
MGPVIEVRNIYKFVKFVRNPSEDGIVDCKELRPRVKVTRLDKSPNSVGMIPEN